jgi:hypothetical protein
MKWNCIGQAVTGTSHIVSAKPCEDALHYAVVQLSDNEHVLICCASDGAGSAKFATEASQLVAVETINRFTAIIQEKKEIGEADIFSVAEEMYELLRLKSEENETSIEEYSCTWLGAVLFPQKAAFFQIGDGAIVRNNGVEGYAVIWPPDNGEYQNSTWFLIDDPGMPQLRCCVIDEAIDELAIFTDGIQMLALKMDTHIVHQPFFDSMFKWLRMADNEEQLATLNQKLQQYLSGDLINQKTDDDKTLFLATRMKS